MRVLLLGASAAVGLLALELVMRAVGGYRLWTPGLRHVLQDASDDTLLAFHRDLVDRFLASAGAQGPGIDPAWLATTPPPVPRLPVPPELEQRFLQYSQWLFLYQINEVLLRRYWVKGQGVPLFQDIVQPDSYWVFQPPGGRAEPRYRYPPGITLPTGMTTNAFGFRGRQVALNKPDGVVRIACVGASTTVEMPNLPHAGPDFLEHWLNLWAERRGLPQRFEVLNAGREAIVSGDIRAIVEDEVLPLAVDYVVYYEGANQFQPATLLRHVTVQGEYQVAVPPPGVVPDFEGQGGADLSLLDRLCGWSAAARRLRSVLQRGERLAEPDKPAQQVTLPPGLDERDPDPARAGEVLAMGTVLPDLAGIDAALRANRARLVLTSFCWLVNEGLELDAVQSRYTYLHLNRSYWPLRYAAIRRLADLQNRCYQAWARQRGVDFVDVAAAMPMDERLFFDAIHNTALGVRLRAWTLFAGLLPLLERDLAAGRVPVPDREIQAAHPNLGPARLLTARELDGQ